MLSWHDVYVHDKLKKREAKLTSKKRVEDKLRREVAKLQCLVNRRAHCAFIEKWSTKVVAQARDELHQLIK
jgi:hypothetical protein